MAWPPVPAMETRRESFDVLVLEAADRLRPHLGTRYAATEFAVEEVPPQDPAPWEEQVAPLGRLLRATTARPNRVVVYRRPLEESFPDPDELERQITITVLHELAHYFGIDEDRIAELGYR